MQKPYTVAEIDALRSAVAMRLDFGTTKQAVGTMIGRIWSGGERTEAIEAQLRTYMIAGITAQDLYNADNPPADQDRNREKTCTT